jgi:hypothetical protein
MTLLEFLARAAVARVVTANFRFVAPHLLHDIVATGACRPGWLSDGTRAAGANRAEG